MRSKRRRSEGPAPRKRQEANTASLEEAGVRRFLGLLKLVVVGVAVVAGARAVYRNRDRLKGGWKAMGGMSGLKGYADRLSVGNLWESVGSIRSLRNLVGQAAHLKKVI
jgi:hypothetical protein